MVEVDIGFHDVHPAIYLWHVLGVLLTGILIYVCRFDPTIMWCYFLFMIFSFAGLFAYVFGWFSDLTSASDDWESGEDEPKTIGIWVIVGLICLVVVSAIISVYTQEGFSMIWVPRELSPLSLSNTAVLPLIVGLVGTWFAVVPGEEGMKSALSATIFKGYEHLEWNIPFFCLQPARILVAIPSWAILHVILGQNAWPFFFSVFIGGVLWDYVSARCGTILVSYIIHGLFNSIILTVSFILLIGLTLVW